MEIIKRNKEKILYIVATPIGNLNDASMNLINVINENEYFIVESILTFKKFLSALKLKPIIKKIVKCDLKTENTKSLRLIDNKNNWVLLSDAGYPLICDPGYNVVKYFKNNDYWIEIIGGPSPIIHALLLSDGPYYPFYFYGFFHKKENQIKKEIKYLLINYKCTIIAYLTKYNLLKVLNVLSNNFKNVSQIIITKELTKKNEKIYKGHPEKILTFFKNNLNDLKGEFVISIKNNIQ